MLHEEDEEEVIQDDNKPLTLHVGRSPRSPGRKRSKFFVESSPTKGSGSESPSPSPVSPVKTSLENPPHHPPPLQPRRSSGSSAGASSAGAKKKKEKRHVSLSTMRGKFVAEKRKAAAALSDAQAANEEGGWEDDEEEEEDEEGWSDEAEEVKEEPPPDPAPAPAPASPSRPALSQRHSSRSGNSSSNLDLAELLSRPTANRKSHKVPPPPAPTPLRKMSKKERMAAEAERAKIEAELDAQRKREMFAKQQIFGTKTDGLLTGMFQRGASMVDLVGRALKSALISDASGCTHDPAQSDPWPPSVLKPRTIAYGTEPPTKQVCRSDPRPNRRERDYPITYLARFVE